MPSNPELNAWVDECARLTRPARVVWCDGSEVERERLVQEMLDDGVLLELDPSRFPSSYLHRSHPQDVARTEDVTFICSRSEADAGPLNHWMGPEDARKKVGALFEGCMRGRTLYVVPYLMGPPGAASSKVAVEITDSPYVVLSMRIMTRMGRAALAHLGSSTDFVRGLHSLGDLDPARRFICHFPEERLIWSVGSGYGGNALLGKKCFALRIASVMGRDEGWLAEHMLIVGIEAPDGETRYIAAAFPSACGKTNLAMLVPPEAMKGYKVWTVGDDIAWLHVGGDGRLRAMNPEAGFFGVAPGTSPRTNPVALETIRKNTIYTNVAMTPDRAPWWEGLEDRPPARLADWQGRDWSPASAGPAAHPNSRFTAPAIQCPSLSPSWEDPEGVPISAILFGGRRARMDPLVCESLDWPHGVYLAATMASETTAAASGDVGKLRRDPMAMRPFCGYNAGDYLAHWLEIGKRMKDPPRIFRVNWFRKDAAGNYLWPGFGENLRVLRWVLDRCEGMSEARESPIGLLPSKDALDLEGLKLPGSSLEELSRVSRDEWAEELRGQEDLLRSLGDRVPVEMGDELRATRKRFGFSPGC